MEANPKYTSSSSVSIDFQVEFDNRDLSSSENLEDYRYDEKSTDSLVIFERSILGDSKDTLKISYKKIILLIYLFIEFVLVCVCAAVLNWIFHNPTCNLLFSCGCTWNWAGGWDNCNIHSTEPIPKCPWCNSSPTVSWTTEYGVIGFMIITYYFVTYSPLLCKSTVYRSINSNIYSQILYFSIRVFSLLVGFGLASVVVGFAFYVSSGYPYFL